MYITITGSIHYLGLEHYKIGQRLLVKKDPDNPYDEEAIKIESENGSTLGYVANSVNTVARGTHSAGYIYNSIKNNQECEVLFVVEDSVIAKLL